QGSGGLAGALLAIAQARRTPVDPFARITRSLSSGAGLPQRHGLLRELALQFSRRQSSRFQAAPSRLQPDPLPAAPPLGLGHHVELYSTPAVVGGSAADANDGGAGMDHLAHVVGGRVWQCL